jgi:hypothetical protein
MKQGQAACQLDQKLTNEHVLFEISVQSKPRATQQHRHQAMTAAGVGFAQIGALSTVDL